MARRQRTSPFEDAIELLSWLFRFIPPCTSIPVAVIGLLIIPLLVVPTLLQPPNPGTAPNPTVSAEFHVILCELFSTLRWAIGVLWAIAWLTAGFAGWQHRRQRAAFLQENIDIKWLWTLSW